MNKKQYLSVFYLVFVFFNFFDCAFAEERGSADTRFEDKRMNFVIAGLTVSTIFFAGTTCYFFCVRDEKVQDLSDEVEKLKNEALQLKQEAQIGGMLRQIYEQKNSLFTEFDDKRLELLREMVTVPKVESAEGQSAEGQSAEGQSAEGQSAEGQSAEGQSAEGQSAANRIEVWSNFEKLSSNLDECLSSKSLTKKLISQFISSYSSKGFAQQLFSLEQELKGLRNSLKGALEQQAVAKIKNIQDDIMKLKNDLDQNSDCGEVGDLKEILESFFEKALNGVDIK